MTQKIPNAPMEKRPVWTAGAEQQNVSPVSFEDGVKALAKRQIPNNVFRVGQVADAQPEVQAFASGSARASNIVQSPASVVELARALKHDVDLIYQHVRNHIDYIPKQGLQKGSWGTLVDGVAGSFDQCQLMIDLLRESGYTADFVFGEIDISLEEQANWLGTDDSSIFHGAFLLAEAGVFNAPYDSGGGVFRNKISHIWVKVTIDGTDYHFDPSFKSYTYTTGIDLGTAMGYDQAALLADAAVGATIDPNGNWIENVNKANIDQKLTDYSTNLVSWIKTNLPTASLEDVIGGRTLDHDTNQVRQTTLPYLSVGTTPTIWTDIPNTYRITVRVQNTLTGIDQTFFGDELYGKRFTIFFNSSMQPELTLDGTLIQTGTAVGLNATLLFDVTFTHPYPTTFFDETVTLAVVGPTGPLIISKNYYTLGIMLGNPQKGLIDFHEGELAANRASGAAELDEEVLGSRLAVIWNTFAAQNARNADILGRMTGCAQVLHHWAGVVSYDDNLDAGVFDLTPPKMSNLSVDGNPDNLNQYVTTWAIHGNSLERLAVQQNAGNKDGFTGSSHLEKANADGTRIYMGTSANWALDVFPFINTASYNPLDMNAIVTPWLNDGWHVLIPQDGDQTIGGFTTDGWNFQHPNGGAAGFLARLKGGVTPMGEEEKKCKCDCEEEGEGDKDGEGWPDFIPALQADPSRPNPVSGGLPRGRRFIEDGSSDEPHGLALIGKYNSVRRFRPGSLGYGWSHNWERELVQISEPFRSLGQSRAIESVPTLVEFLVCLNLTNDSSLSILNTLTTWMVNDWWCDQVCQNIISADVLGGSVEFVQMPDGSFSYTGNHAWEYLEASGQSTVTGPRGQKYVFDNTRKLKSIEFPFGITINLTYVNDKLVSVTNGLGPVFNFVYDGDSLSSVSDSSGRSIGFNYDSSGQLEKVTDVAGDEYSYAYASTGLLEKYYLPENPSVPLVENTWDSLGRVKEQLDSNGSLHKYYFASWRTEEEDHAGNSRVREFDSRGNLVKIVDPKGNETSFQYDNFNRLILKTMPEGNSTSWIYDDRGNVTSRTMSPKPGSMLSDITETYTYHATFNKVTSHTDGNGNTTTFTYDATSGVLLSVTKPLVNGISPVVNFVYNTFGQLIEREDETGIKTRFEYSLSGSRLEKVISDFGVGGLNLVTEIKYDAAGNPIEIIDPRGNATQYTFDVKRRLVETRSPAPFLHVTKLSYDKNGNRVMTETETGNPLNPWQVFESTFNASNQTVSSKDPMGYETIREYDELHRLRRITDPEIRISQYEYDERGYLTGVINAAGNSSQLSTFSANGMKLSDQDANGNVTIYTYDGFDRLSRTTYPDGTFEETAVYDSNNNPLVMRNRNGDLTSLSFDALNQLSQKTPDGMPAVTYEYDLAGRLVSLETPVETNNPASGKWLYGYDSAGRIVSEQAPDFKKVSYQLDENGNVIRVTYPDSYYVEREYDELNRLVALKLNGSTIPTVVYEYDALYRRTKQTFSNGAVTEYDYDSNNTLSDINLTFASSAVSFEFGYNKVRQLISKTSTDNQYFRTPSAASITSYSSANNLNQYPLVDGLAFTYDGNGCLKSDGIWTFDYDAENQLVSANDGLTFVSYRYSPLRRQIEKTVGTNKTRYVYSGWQRIADYDGVTDTLSRRYIYGSNLDEPVLAIDSLGDIEYLHRDHLGSIIAVSDSSGNVVNTYSYGTFGENDNLSDSAFGFTGQRYDADTGLYYYKNRYYSPKLGRFIQPDSIMAPNLYEYVNNDPLNNTDPLGRALAAAVAVLLQALIIALAMLVFLDMMRRMKEHLDKYGNPCASIAEEFKKLLEKLTGFGGGNQPAPIVDTAPSGAPDNVEPSIPPYTPVPVDPTLPGFEPSPIPIDPYFFAKPFGVGGQSEVWDAYHPEYFTPYATHKRYHPDGSIKSVQTYDFAGRQLSRFDLRDTDGKPEHRHNTGYGPGETRGYGSRIHRGLDEVNPYDGAKQD